MITFGMDMYAVLLHLGAVYKPVRHCQP